jgi:hypothetical protein
MIVSKNGVSVIQLELTTQEAQLVSSLVQQGLVKLGETDQDLAKATAIPALKIAKQIFDRVQLAEAAIEQDDSGDSELSK